MTAHLPYNEKEFIARLANREAAAFDDLYNACYERLLFFARKFVLLELAEDILSDAFVKLWARTERFNSLAEVEQWLRVTVKNACIDELRREDRIEKKERAYLYLTDQQYEELYFRSSVEAELFARIIKEIDKLPALTGNIIKLSFLKGLSVDEIAAQLNLRKQVVYNKKSLGIKALRLSIADNELILLMTLSANLLASL